MTTYGIALAAVMLWYDGIWLLCCDMMAWHDRYI